MEYRKLIKKRRSVYALEKGSPVSDEELIRRVKEAVSYSPTAFDSRATRIVIALGDSHSFVWKSVHDALEKIVPPAKFRSTEEKLKAFDGAYGTVLVYKDLTAIEELKKEYPTYANRQDDWGEQNVGILVHALWLTLVDLGFGVNIQHYDPLLDEAVNREFGVEDGLKLETEIVFGLPNMVPEEKEIPDPETRVREFH